VPWSPKLSPPLCFLSEILYAYLIQTAQQQMDLTARTHVYKRILEYFLWETRYIM
jgi:hypothetical protein